MQAALKNIVLMVLMLISAGLGAALRPHSYLADQRPAIDLAAMVPSQFDGWTEQRDLAAQIINPQQKEVIDQIYSQTLSRTYANAQGYRIMLSIAYGKNQSDALQLHKPEVCYPAQGFTVLANQRGTLDLLGRSISAVRIDTVLGQRHEPVTYWTVVGDHITQGGIDKKLVEMRYALEGRVPDGMLVRVSSIEPDTGNAYALQRQFASAMVAAIAPEHRTRFAGNNP